MVQYLKRRYEDENKQTNSTKRLNRRRAKVYRIAGTTSLSASDLSSSSNSTEANYRGKNPSTAEGNSRDNQEKGGMNSKSNVYIPYGSVQKNQNTKVGSNRGINRIQELKKSIQQYARNGKQKIIRSSSHYQSPKDRIKVNKRKRGKKKISATKKMFKQKMLEKMLDGVDESGFLAKLFTIVMLLPILIKVIIITVVVGVVAAIIASIVSFFVALISLFTIKTDDMILTETYVYVSQLDAETNKSLQDTISKYETSDYEVNLYVNSSRSSSDEFLFMSDIDTIIYYLNTKYDDYELSTKTKGNNPFGGATIKEEIKNMHKAYFNYDVEVGEKEVEKVIAVVDDETGEETIEVIIESKEVADIYVTAINFYAFLDEYPYCLEEDEAEQMYFTEGMEQYEDKIEMDSPFGDTSSTVVLNRYGYRGTDTKTEYEEIDLQATEGKTVHAMTRLEIEEVSNNQIVAFGSNSKKIIYKNLKTVSVKKGQVVNRGEVIGTAKDILTIQVRENRMWKPDPYLNPSFYINNLNYSYGTNLGHITTGGGITGDLINPPATVTKWRDDVERVAIQYGIGEYVNTLLAIIWVESGGNEHLAPDIMQASESLTGEVGSIKDPIQSINQGVRYFAELLAIATSNGLDDYAALQAYNYGGDFLYELIKNETTYSFSEAVAYANEKSSGKRVSYSNKVATNRGYDWRYQYGNMFYVDLVTQYIFLETNSLVEIAKNEVGYVNGDKYWRWYGYNSRVEWCAIFVSWVANQSGHIQNGKVYKHSNCKAQVEWFRSQGRYEEAGGSYMPQSGDLIYFDYDGRGEGDDHVGIVESTDGSTVTTIEGNTSNKVARRTYSINDITISGYGLTN